MVMSMRMLSFYKFLWIYSFKSVIIFMTILERGDLMVTITNKRTIEKNNSDATKLELYRLIGQGYKAMQEGRVSSIDDVRERMKQRRENRG